MTARELLKLALSTVSSAWLDYVELTWSFKIRGLSADELLRACATDPHLQSLTTAAHRGEQLSIRGWQPAAAALRFVLTRTPAA